MISPRYKSIYHIILILLLLASTLFLLYPEMDAAAQAPKPPSTIAPAIGNALAGSVAKAGEMGTTMIAIVGILTALFSVFSLLLGIVGALLDNVFNWNLMWDPSLLPFVQDGWVLMRDLANGVFILVILWIAITIIFNLEQWGGKKLLVRVIVIALLINFSLLMVSVVFGFANTLAKPFHTALGLNFTDTKLGVSAVILRNTQIHQVADKIRSEGAIKAFQEGIKQPSAAAPNNGSAFASLWRSFGAPQEAHALGPLGFALVFFGITIASSIISALLSVAVAYALINAYWQQTLNLVVADGFLLVTLLAMLTMSVLLTLRIIAMIFLGIFAPIAFISMVIPRYGERFWNQWIQYLFNWAFMAPVFYFLFYLGLLMLQTLSASTPGKDISFSGNVFKMINLSIFLIFLWAAIITARKMGGMVAETALSLGKRVAGFGLGVATGGFARFALPAAGRFATGLNKRINRVPFLRGSLGKGITGYGLRRVAATGRQQVIDRQRRFEGMTSEEIQQWLASTSNFQTPLGKIDTTAAVSVLQKRKDLAPIKGVVGYGERQQRTAADTIKGLGLNFKEFLRANPAIAQAKDFDPDQIAAEIKNVQDIQERKISEAEAALRLAWKDVRAHDIDTMDLGMFSDTTKLDLDDGREQFAKGDLMKEMYLEFAQGDHFTRLGRANTSVAKDVQNYLENTQRGQRLWGQFDDKKKDYFTSNAARELAWRTPSYTQSAGGDNPPTITPIPPMQMEGRVGNQYNKPLAASGGDGRYTNWRVASGSLPPGVNLHPSTGVLSGQPTTAGTYQFEIEVTDGARATSQPRSIRITVSP